MLRQVDLQQQATNVGTTLVAFEPASSASNKALSIHRWANWIAGFSGDFAQGVIKQYLPSPKRKTLVLDPFAGVGTTLVEAYRQKIDCVGFEINPFAALVTRVKLQAVDVDVLNLQMAIDDYRRHMRDIDFNKYSSQQAPRSIAPPGFRSRIPFFSNTIETKVLHTLDYLEDLPQPIQDIFRVALGSVLVGFSNYTYEPSLGSRPGAGKPLIDSAPVGEIVFKKLEQMVEDIAMLQQETCGRNKRPSRIVYCSTYFESDHYIEPCSVDLVVTSPPYMNNYHYVRNTRPQLYWTALATSNTDLKLLEEANFGKFWQTVRSRKEIPLDFAMPDLELQIREIRQKNNDRGVYGGGGWANYVSVYMNDLYRFAGLLARQLRPRTGIAAVVLGNSVIQGSPMPVERYMSQIAELHGLETQRTDVLRSRVGSSIVNSGTRLTGEKKYGLYDFAVVLRKSSG
jgi:hypothetical protein